MPPNPSQLLHLSSNVLYTTASAQFLSESPPLACSLSLNKEKSKLNPNLVIAVSSPHRKEAFVACESILEDVKQRAQIWKREYYEGEDESTAEWKANS